MNLSENPADACVSCMHAEAEHGIVNRACARDGCWCPRFESLEDASRGAAKTATRKPGSVMMSVPGLKGDNPGCRRCGHGLKGHAAEGDGRTPCGVATCGCEDFGWTTTPAPYTAVSLAPDHPNYLDERVRGLAQDVVALLNGAEAARDPKVVELIGTRLQVFLKDHHGRVDGFLRQQRLDLEKKRLENLGVDVSRAGYPTARSVAWVQESPPEEHLTGDALRKEMERL